MEGEPKRTEEQSLEEGYIEDVKLRHKLLKERLNHFEALSPKERQKELQDWSERLDRKLDLAIAHLDAETKDLREKKAALLQKGKSFAGVGAALTELQFESIRDGLGNIKRRNLENRDMISSRDLSDDDTVGFFIVFASYEYDEADKFIKDIETELIELKELIDEEGMKEVGQ